jgi:hypothetical protein
MFLRQPLQAYNYAQARQNCLPANQMIVRPEAKKRTVYLYPGSTKTGDKLLSAGLRIVPDLPTTKEEQHGPQTQ